MRTALTLALVVALGCGKPERASEPAKSEQVPDPKPNNPDPTPTDPKPKYQPKSITWETSELNNAPGYLMPYEKSDPEKVLEKVQKELPTEKAANDLLKKLIRVETLTFEVVRGPAPKEPVFAHPPRGEGDGLVSVYLQPGKRSEKKNLVFLDFQYSVVSSRSSTLFANTDNFAPIQLAINDFLLRNKLGCVFVAGRADQWDQSQTAEELRKQLDTDIAEYLKQNARMPLKKKP